MISVTARSSHESTAESLQLFLTCRDRSTYQTHEVSSDSRFDHSESELNKSETETYLCRSNRFFHILHCNRCQEVSHSYRYNSQIHPRMIYLHLRVQFFPVLKRYSFWRRRSPRLSVIPTVRCHTRLAEEIRYFATLVNVKSTYFHLIYVSAELRIKRRCQNRFKRRFRHFNSSNQYSIKICPSAVVDRIVWSVCCNSDVL